MKFFEIKEVDVFWYMKKCGEIVILVVEDIKLIYMLSNFGVFIIVFGFFGFVGFVLVFSWFWFVVIGGIGILVCLIYCLFDYDEGYYISVDEIKKIEYIV